MSSWSRSHQFRYLLAVVAVVVIAAGATYWVRRPQPTCSDGLKNQNELGVDCGGVCTRVCRDEALPLIIKWVQVFPVRTGVFDAAAYVTNPNTGFELRSFNYRFKVYDAAQQLIAEREGKAFVTPGEQMVIFEPLVKTRERAAARAFLEVAPNGEDLLWTRAVGGRVPQLSVKSKLMETNPVPTLSVLVRNGSSFEASNVIVTGVLYNTLGNVLGVSAARLVTVPRLSDTPVTLTWPNQFSEAVISSEIYFHAPRVP